MCSTMYSFTHNEWHATIKIVVFTDSMNSALIPARRLVSSKYVGTTDTVGGSGTKKSNTNNNYAKIRSSSTIIVLFPCSIPSFST